ncbi:MAG: DivIVA domain-containing protein [Christensenellales bacterium]
MSLTAKDILEKTFKRSFKGYDEDEVDKFLDQIIDEFKALQSENESLKQELDSAKEQAKKIKETEETIMHTLVSAQKTSERILNEAARKAELVIDNAETTAKRRAEQTTRELSLAEAKLEEVKKSAQRFAESYASMINAEASSFEKIYRSYFGDIGAIIGGGINKDALERIDGDITQSLKEIEPQETAPKPDLDLTSAPDPEAKKTLLEFNEINQALTELEKGDDILQDSYEDIQPPKAQDEKQPGLGGFKPKYDDYSWLYENDDKQDDNFELSFKDPKEKDELKSLIDEIIE